MSRHERVCVGVICLLCYVFLIGYAETKWPVQIHHEPMVHMRLFRGLCCIGDRVLEVTNALHLQHLTCPPEMSLTLMSPLVESRSSYFP